jgi:hypothetical protein
VWAPAGTAGTVCGIGGCSRPKNIPDRAELVCPEPKPGPTDAVKCWCCVPASGAKPLAGNWVPGTRCGTRSECFFPGQPRPVCSDPKPAPTEEAKCWCCVPAPKPQPQMAGFNYYSAYS